MDIALSNPKYNKWADIVWFTEAQYRGYREQIKSKVTQEYTACTDILNESIKSLSATSRKAQVEPIRDIWSMLNYLSMQ